MALELRNYNDLTNAASISKSPCSVKYLPPTAKQFWKITFKATSTQTDGALSPGHDKIDPPSSLERLEKTSTTTILHHIP
jgi:hypothetical protein